MNYLFKKNYATIQLAQLLVEDDYTILPYLYNSKNIG